MFVRTPMKWMLIMAKRLPDEREAIKGAGVATATAAGRLSGADLVAGAGSYGIARSLAVLALEESVKARSLGAIAAAAAQGRRPGFSDDDLRKIVYSGHRERHAAGFVQHVAAAFPDVYGRVMLGMYVGAADAAKIGELTGLLDAANCWKQVGFYSDFDPDSGSWSSPGTVTEAEFAKIRALIGEFMNETQRQLDDFTRYRAAGQAAAGS
jgi:AbiV family abortive infection protein